MTPIIKDAMIVQVEETKIYAYTGYKHVCYRIVGIDGRAVADDRFIYLDNSKYCWYAKDSSHDPVRYHVNRSGYQHVTLNGVIFRINTGVKFEVRRNIAAIYKRAVTQYRGAMVLDKVYRLKNGAKMQLVAKVVAGDFSSETIYIGAYKNGTVRYSADCKLLSHGGKDEWSIECEWKNVELWVITYSEMDGKFKSATLTSEAAADAYVKEHKLCVVAKTKITT